MFFFKGILPLKIILIDKVETRIYILPVSDRLPKICTKTLASVPAPVLSEVKTEIMYWTLIVHLKTKTIKISWTRLSN
jgi:hypothetical protein